MTDQTPQPAQPADQTQQQPATTIDPDVAAQAPGNDPSNAPGPLDASTTTDPRPVNPSQTAPVARPGDATTAQQTTPPASAAVSVAGPDAAPDPTATGSYAGPNIGSVVAFTDYDPYVDADITRYGLVVGEHPRNTDDPQSTDRAEIAWLPEGTAVLAVDDLDEL